MAVATGQYKKRIEDLDNRIAELTKLTTVSSPETNAAQAEWEKSVSSSTKPLLAKWQSISQNDTAIPMTEEEQYIHSVTEGIGKVQILTRCF